MYTLTQSTPQIRNANYFKFRVSDKDRVGYCYAFHLFNGGAGSVTIGETSFEIGKGTLVYIPPLVPHAFYNDPDNPLTCYNIYCELWNETGADSPLHLTRDSHSYQSELLTKILSCMELDSFPSTLSLQHRPFLMDLFSHIVHLFEENNLKNKSQIMNGLVFNWLLELYSISLMESPLDYRIKRVIEIIDRSGGAEDYEEWLRISRLNKSQFYQAFKKMTNMTPKNYALNVKMKQAAATLLDSNKTVTEISESMGYSSIHYFTNQFIKFYGESPSAFRKVGYSRFK